MRAKGRDARYWVSLAKSSSFETRRKCDAPQDEDALVRVSPHPEEGRRPVSKDGVKLTHYLTLWPQRLRKDYLHGIDERVVDPERVVDAVALLEEEAVAAAQEAVEVAAGLEHAGVLVDERLQHEVVGLGRDLARRARGGDADV